MNELIADLEDDIPLTEYPQYIERDVLTGEERVVQLRPDETAYEKLGSIFGAVKGNAIIEAINKTNLKTNEYRLIKTGDLQTSGTVYFEMTNPNKIKSLALRVFADEISLSAGSYFNISLSNTSYAIARFYKSSAAILLENVDIITNIDFGATLIDGSTTTRRYVSTAINGTWSQFLINLENNTGDIRFNKSGTVTLVNAKYELYEVYQNAFL